MFQYVLGAQAIKLQHTCNRCGHFEEIPAMPKPTLTCPYSQDPPAVLEFQARLNEAIRKEKEEKAEQASKPDYIHNPVEEDGIIVDKVICNHCGLVGIDTSTHMQECPEYTDSSYLGLC